MLDFEKFFGDKLNFGVPGEAPQDHDILTETPESITRPSPTIREYAGVPALDNIFAWVRNFVYVWTGTPNTGKTTMLFFMMVLMSKTKHWKWVLWSPEMIDSEKQDRVIYTARDIWLQLIWMWTGVTPFEAYAKKHNTDLLPKQKIIDTYNELSKYFTILHLRQRSPKAIMEAFSKHEADGYVIDPWKNVHQAASERYDIWLSDVLGTIKEFALDTNSCFNIIVHPKSMKDYKDDNGDYRIITPFDLNGGATWNNSPDAIISLRRKNLTQDILEWYTYKARKQHATFKPDKYEGIVFDMNTFRFYFDGKCPIDGTKLPVRYGF